MSLHLPRGMRPSSVGEREAFYRDFFDVEKAWEFLRPMRSYMGRPVFAVNLGRKTGLLREEFRGIVERRKIWVLFISRYRDLRELREKFVKYAPEGVYYWRNAVRDYDQCRTCPLKRKKFCFHCPNYVAQELVFDVDPENLERRRYDFPFSFSMKGFRLAAKKVVELYLSLREEFKRVVIVYSGRGFHIHVQDRKAFLMGPEERKELAEQYAGYGIDMVVTEGKMDLIRLPYSLNAVVNRVVFPFTKTEEEELIKDVLLFDPRRDPRVLFHHSSPSSSHSSSSSPQSSRSSPSSSHSSHSSSSASSSS